MEFWFKLFDEDFAARWDGACSGWTERLTLWMSSFDFVIFLCYMAIPAALWPARRVLPAKIAQPIAFFVLTCGVGHLVDVATNFHPAYRASICWRGVTAAVSVWATLVVFFRLRLYLRNVAVTPKSELHELMEELRGLKEDKGARG